VRFFLDTFVYQFLTISLAFTAFYLIWLFRAVRACRPENRAMSPWLVWLELSLGLTLVWQFVNVIAVSRSLGREWRSRGVAAGSPGENLGLAYCALSVLAFTAGLVAEVGEGTGDPALVSPWWSALSWIAFALGLLGTIAWFLYWTRIATETAELKAEAPVTLVAGGG
jgi:hypothetical protein